MNELTQGLYRAIDIARHAPSSHNSQPWRVNIISDDKSQLIAAIGFDSTRMLTTLPKLNDEMFISLGVFTGFLKKTLTAQSIEAKVQWVQKGYNIIQITLTKAAINHAYYFDESLIIERHTARGPYLSTGLSNDQKYTLSESMQGNIECRFIESLAEKQKIKSLVNDYAGLDFANKAVWAETYRHIQFANQHKDHGFTLKHLFGDVSSIFEAAFRLGFHPKNHFLYQALGMPNRLAKGLADLMEKTPCFFALTIKEEMPKAFYTTGLSLADFMYQATELGLSINPVSVLLQNDTPRKKLESLIANDRKIAFFARIGIAEHQGIASARRSKESICSTYI
ncbi:MAG: hypothetical protein OXE99_13385 [Cellvibrionales bacterium]|nr:hypothetical protein [Cellvibrionales bacterium]